MNIKNENKIKEDLMIMGRNLVKYVKISVGYSGVYDGKIKKISIKPITEEDFNDSLPFTSTKTGISTAETYLCFTLNEKLVTNIYHVIESLVTAHNTEIDRYTKELNNTMSIDSLKYVSI